MKTKLRMRHEILLATSNRAFNSSFKKESSIYDLILDAVDSPQKLTRFSKKEISPEIMIFDLDSMSHNLSAFIFYFNQFKTDLPVMVVSHAVNVTLMDEVNKNLPVVLSLPLPTTKQSFRELLINVLDFLNEDLKKKIDRVEFLKDENIFACTFENKEKFFISRKDIPEDDKTASIESCERSPDQYYFTIKYRNGESLDIPWDFVRPRANKEYEFNVGKKQKKSENLTAEEIGKRIIQIREQKSMTQEQLSTRTGILRNNISRIENGYHQPSLPILEKIAEGLKIPVVNLLARNH